MPSVAITVRTLAVYRQTHRVCPRLSIHAEAKKLCHMHHIRYRRYLADQLRAAYDVYLELQRHVSHRLDKCLGRDTPDWRMLNSCTACQYTLEGEPPLLYSIICACDGNNSAKLVDPAVRSGVERPDPRSGTSPIWLSESYVDQFADEVGNARRNSRPGIPLAQARDPDDPWIEEPDSSDSSEPVSICVDRWRNAAPESRKKMFAIFKNHGFLLTICDMVRSGELMKYPIASLKKLMDVFGKNILYSYDIKCALEKILLRSSLADQIKQLNLQGVVPAFHGHAHNRLCQVQHHSKYKVGAGKEDFETCERLWTEHFRFADMDKYASLSNFLYHNYVQALQTISATSTFLDECSISRDAPFESDWNDEKASLQTMARKKEETVVEIDYVKALLEYDSALSNYSSKEIGNIRRRHTHAAAKRDQKQEVVEDFERQMGIEQRWGPDHPERIKAQSRIMHRLFFKALDDVERLVVMQLLELTKLQMNGLGYKLRTQISKALKSCASAIRNALQRYNKYAAQMIPPRPPLEWEQIVEFSFLAEFDLLRDGDAQLHSKRWANPLYQQASMQYFDGMRAKEEIERLNVEIGCLLTKICDDAVYYPQTIATLAADDPPLASELGRQWDQLRSLNLWHLQRIRQTQALHGYSGPLKPADVEDAESEEPYNGERMQQVEGYISGLEHHIADNL
ncbi:hypothetical protein DEU56DRAFT_930524 [Suillus clintonianus]|uniref:uncharacterized protein n=1 Tax=Suillus clintonianus TaxID=1904413 RepID=UPI001B884EE0|nr:uncharacterized protein DEU56DRAFT_930524 [Suillus clintonianus]KAG2118322.1 hypothetical protein DEU56DRAFT_930524 [Suillus clintonianus]